LGFGFRVFWRTKKGGGINTSARARGGGGKIDL
jgi:hypothetical protein